MKTIFTKYFTLLFVLFSFVSVAQEVPREGEVIYSVKIKRKAKENDVQKGLDDMSKQHNVKIDKDMVKQTFNILKNSPSALSTVQFKV